MTVRVRVVGFFKVVDYHFIVNVLQIHYRRLKDDSTMYLLLFQLSYSGHLPSCILTVFVRAVRVFRLVS